MIHQVELEFFQNKSIQISSWTALTTKKSHGGKSPVRGVTTGWSWVFMPTPFCQRVFLRLMHIRQVYGGRVHQQALVILFFALYKYTYLLTYRLPLPYDDSKVSFCL